MAQISDAVAEVLAQSIYDGNKLVLPGQMDRDLYVKTDTVLRNLGGTWSRKDKAHVFRGMTNERLRELVGSAAASQTFTDRKKELQFFPTPAKVAHLMAELAQIEFDDVVLEPSAGHGDLINPILAQKKTRAIYALDIDMSNADEICRRFTANVRPICRDFLSWADEQDGILFDAIVMNPPFSNGQDIAHVRAAWGMLRPGRRLVAITSPGWTFRQDTKHREFKEWLESEGAITDELPAGTFKEAGTDIRTMLIVLQKEKDQ